MSGIFDRLKKGAGDAAHAAEKMARIRRLEGDINELRKEIDEHYHKMGELVYKSKVAEAEEDPKVAKIVPDITYKLQKIKAIEEEIKEVEEET